MKNCRDLSQPELQNEFQPGLPYKTLSQQQQQQEKEKEKINLRKKKANPKYARIIRNVFPSCPTETLGHQL